jgi:hypothetical protein
MKKPIVQIAKCTFQQGDVIGVKIDKIPTGDRNNITKKRLVVAHGESGHSHVIQDDAATMFQVGDRFYLELEKTAMLTHEEHKPITLSPGVWEIGRVQEYDWFSRMQRQVVD